MSNQTSNPRPISLYPRSLQKRGDTTFAIARDAEGKFLLCLSPDASCRDLEGQPLAFAGINALRCPLSDRNARVLRSLFPYTAPVSHKGRKTTMGLGDRLGLASVGHIRTVRGRGVFPVLAQQSMRELALTGRTYEDVLSAATWAVFEEAYADGYGADGDHLKTHEEVKAALGFGLTMITLDCSEHIPNHVFSLSDDEADALYAKLSAERRSAVEAMYLGKTFPLDGGGAVTFTKSALARIVLIYTDAVAHMINVYETLIKPAGSPVDFEISIDETVATTSPEAHFFVADELKRAGVPVSTMAPRFCGEFQKGIDYIGNIGEFTVEFSIHTAIARTFGYKLSVHSGSDKFSVFPIIGRETDGLFHLKTAGTNWLEAVRVIARKAPELFRSLYAFALAHLAEAKKYYVITENVNNIPSIDSLTDEQLPSLLDQNDARQVLHVTYGLILTAKDANGAPLFSDAIRRVLDQNEEAYASGLEGHIGRHLDTLGIAK